MKKLVLVAHDNFDASRINRALVEAVQSLDNVTVHHIPQPHLIDVTKEQELLLAHDEIVFQFPLQWFSSPASLKSWFDKVLSYNWAYGENYNLSGKTFRVVLTTGGVTEAYLPGGQNGITFDEVLKPIEKTVGYIKGVYAQPFLVNGVYQLSDEDLKTKAKEFASTLV